MWLALFLKSLHMISESAQKSRVGSETLPHKVSPNKDVRDLSEGDYDVSIWLIVWCVLVCEESHFSLSRYNIILKYSQIRYCASHGWVHPRGSHELEAQYMWGVGTGDIDKDEELHSLVFLIQPISLNLSWLNNKCNDREVRVIHVWQKYIALHYSFDWLISSDSRKHNLSFYIPRHRCWVHYAMVQPTCNRHAHLMSLSPKFSCQPCLLMRLDIKNVGHTGGRRKIG